MYLSSMRAPILTSLNFMIASPCDNQVKNISVMKPNYIFNYFSLSLKLLVFRFSQLRYEIPKSAYEISKSAISFSSQCEKFPHRKFLCFQLFHKLFSTVPRVVFIVDYGYTSKTKKVYISRVIQIEKWTPVE